MSGEKTNSHISRSQEDNLLAIKSLFLLLGILFLSSFSWEDNAWFWHCLDSCLLEKWKREDQKSLQLRKAKGLHVCLPGWVGSAPGKVRRNKNLRNKNFLSSKTGDSIPGLALKLVTGGHYEMLLLSVSKVAPQRLNGAAGAQCALPRGVFSARADKQSLFWIVLHFLGYQLHFSRIFNCVHDDWVL